MVMTVSELLEQAKALTPQERRELAGLLIQLAEMSPRPDDSETEAHWGQNLLRLLDEFGPIELAYPEIDDPVEWVKRVRHQQVQERLGNWGQEE